MNRHWSLAGWLLASFVLLALGGWLTSLGLGPWYKALNFSSFQPPSWVFTPAWVVILSLLGIAIWKITGPGGQSTPVMLSSALLLYGAQFILNAGWSLLFFSVRRPDYALWAIIALLVVLVAMIIAYFKISKTSGWMLVPYLAWLLFATAINVAIVNDNPVFG